MTAGRTESYEIAFNAQMSRQWAFSAGVWVKNMSQLTTARQFNSGVYEYKVAQNGDFGTAIGFDFTIEVRHAPFIGWITDLSAPDPSSILNLFGLLPFSPPGPESFLVIFSIGVYPILMGITMWWQQKLNPAPTDKTQQMIFAWMPWIFMFLLGQFSSGLVIYWVANNIITFAQQYFIMASQGVKPDIFGNILSSFKKEGASKEN